MVAIVTGLVASITFGEIGSLNAVATAREGAKGRTGIGVDLIAIIACFAEV